MPVYRHDVPVQAAHQPDARELFSLAEARPSRRLFVAGHAVQHAEGYVPNKIRSSVIPVANITSRLSTPLIIAGFLFSDTLIWVGIVAYSLAVLVYLVTLPVEFDASRRALATIKSNYILDENEYKGAKSVLTAAAMTYVASALSALIQFLRLVLIANSRRRN